MTQPLPMLEFTKQDRVAVTSSAAAILQKIKDLADAAGCTTETYSISGTLSAVGIKFADAAVSDLRVVFAAHASLQAPLMLTPDTETVNVMMVAVAKGVTVETLGDWRSGANPYGGSSVFSGFWKCSTVLTAITFAGMLVSDEALILHLDNGTSACGCEAGAVIDPHSEDIADCETSGRVYGMATSSGIAWSTVENSGNFAWYHNVTANTTAHAGAWKPRTSTWTPMRRTLGGTLIAPSGGTSTMLRLNSTASIGLPLWVESSDATPIVYGRVREVTWWHRASAMDTVNRDVGVAGYIWGSYYSSVAACYFVAARDNRSPN